VNLSCASGSVLQVSNATVNSEALSCFSYVADNCSGKSSCAPVFDAANCKESPTPTEASVLAFCSNPSESLTSGMSFSPYLPAMAVGIYGTTQNPSVAARGFPVTGSTGTDANWTVAQWGTDDPLIDFGKGSQASGAGLSYESANGRASVKVTNVANNSEVQSISLSQNGGNYPCTTASGSPNEFDLYYGPSGTANTPALQSASLTSYAPSIAPSLAQLGSMRVNTSVSFYSWTPKTSLNCAVNQSSALYSVVLSNASKKQTLFYQIELNASGSATYFFQGTASSGGVGVYGIDDYLPAYGQPVMQKSGSYSLNIDLLPELLKLVQNAQYGMDPHPADWTIGGIYVGGHIWGDTGLSTIWYGSVAPVFTLSSVPTIVDAWGGSGQLIGGWYEEASSVHINGAAAVGWETGSQFISTVVGSSITLSTSPGPNRGIAQVTIDGGAPHWVDLYATTYGAQVPNLIATGLSNGPHTVVVEVSGTQNSASSGHYLVLEDVSGVSPSQIDFSNPAVQLQGGGWYPQLPPAYGTLSGNPDEVCRNTDSSVTVSVTGSEITLLANSGANRGILRYYIDGGAPQLLDLYMPGYPAHVPYVLASGLASGTHIVTIEVTGTQSQDSSGTYLVLETLEAQ
jgi:hypothetical protein